jgi:hypothetical protein
MVLLIPLGSKVGQVARLGLSLLVLGHLQVDPSLLSNKMRAKR